VSPASQTPGSAPSRILGVDTGGTFTDLVRIDGGEPRVEKLPSTPGDPARAVLEGIERLGGAGTGSHVIHGTTVALNALLTGRTARTALVTNEGFRDLIEIGRQDRPDLYALHPEKPRPIVPRELRFEVGQRSWPGSDADNGLASVDEPAPEELRRLQRALKKARPESIAVCLLHAYADPEIERSLARELESLGLPITCSASVLQEYREFERFSTAVVNAALVPLMGRYIEALAGRLPGARLSLLQSNGGTLPAAQAAVEPVRVLLSGPAGGVVGAARAAREAGYDRLVGLDMGGTSTDVAFFEAGASERVLDGPARVAGRPVGVPALDIHTIGCGGGSLVEVDRGGVMRVGPGSAGADPGPVCYGQSDQLTVTDAHVLLGHIASGSFLGGHLELDTDGVKRAFEDLGRRLSVKPHTAAEGVLEVARAAMRRAVGVMTMQRGQDPHSLPLVAFGGAGGLHAAALADSLGMRAALVPHHPGVLSALGMAGADAIREHSATVLAPLSRWKAARRRKALRELAERGREQLRQEGFRVAEIELELGLDLRYAGQSFEIRVPEGPRCSGAFEREHERLYGYRLPDREVELVNLRVRALVRRALPPARRPRSRPLPKSAIRGERRVRLGRVLKVPVIDRGRLAPGHRFEGPALIEEYSGTSILPPGWTARVAGGGHLEMISG